MFDTWSPVHPALELVDVEEPGLNGVAVEDAAFELVHSLLGVSFSSILRIPKEEGQKA